MTRRYRLLIGESEIRRRLAGSSHAALRGVARLMRDLRAKAPCREPRPFVGGVKRLELQNAVSV